jgi:hypothetical protein
MTAGKLHCYYANANRCSRWALEATSDEYRRVFLDMAVVWGALAVTEERRTLQACSLPVVSTSMKPTASVEIRSTLLSKSTPSGRHLFNGEPANRLN